MLYLTHQIRRRFGDCLTAQESHNFAEYSCNASKAVLETLEGNDEVSRELLGSSRNWQVGISCILAASQLEAEVFELHENWKDMKRTRLVAESALGAAMRVLEGNDCDLALNMALDSHLIFSVLLELLSEDPLPGAAAAFRQMARWPRLNTFIEVGDRIGELAINFPSLELRFLAIGVDDAY